MSKIVAVQSEVYYDESDTQSWRRTSGEFAGCRDIVFDLFPIRLLFCGDALNKTNCQLGVGNFLLPFAFSLDVTTQQFFSKYESLRKQRMWSAVVVLLRTMTTWWWYVTKTCWYGLRTSQTSHVCITIIRSRTATYHIQQSVRTTRWAPHTAYHLNLQPCTCVVESLIPCFQRLQIGKEN